MSAPAATAEPLRYERKFVVTELSRHELTAVVRLHPAVFSQAYPPRYVNNIYLDSPDMQSYFSNVDGLAERTKVRVRWYGNLLGTIARPVVEIKRKHGLTGSKTSFALPPFQLEQGFEGRTLAGLLATADLPGGTRAALLALEMTVINRYRRWYYESRDRRYRLTLDSEVTFYQVRANGNSFLRKTTDVTSTVLELKYAPEHDDGANRLLSRFPFRMTKSSKYVSGVNSVYLW